MEKLVRVNRSRPNFLPESQESMMRGGRFGEGFVMPLYGKKHFLADEGSYFVATNPTPYTSIAVTTSIVTFAETAGEVGVGMLMRNSTPRTADDPIRVYLDYIKLLCKVVPATSTSWQYALTLDDNASRRASGGSAITPVCPNGALSKQSIVSMYFGAINTGVPVNRRLVSRGMLRGVVPTIFDEFLIISGGAEGGGSHSGAAASGRQTDICPPIIIGPEQNLALTMWGAACNAASEWEFEIGWWER